VGAAIVACDDLDVLMTTPPIAVLVLDPGVGETDVPVFGRQLVLARPPSNFLRLAVRAAVAIFASAIALVKEPW
jgi:hypothetical protein